jgi:5'-nucleotidase
MRCSWIAFSVVLSLAVVGAAYATSSAPLTVKILALNDFHGNLQSPGTFNPGPGAPAVPAGGIEVLAGYVADLKHQNPHHVVVSAGDLIGASPLISALFHDEGTIETMNRLGLEFHAVGNHEFDEGTAELRRMQHGGCHATDPEHSCQGALVGTPTPFEGATFTFLAANVVDTATGKTLFPPYSIKRFGHVRVAFIGLTLKDTPRIVIPTGVAGLQFQDEADTVNALLPHLHAQGVAAIVVLLHQGGAQTTPPSPPDINACVGGLGGSPVKAIVGRLDDAVDLVISGHTHQAYNCRLPNKVGRAIPVTSAHAFGRVLTDIDMQIDPLRGQVVRVTATNIVVDRTTQAITPHALIAAIVAKYEALVAPLANQVIGSLTEDVPNSKSAACDVPAGELIADAQLEATLPAAFGGAQVALMNPGGVRGHGFVFQQSSGGAPPGDLTYGEAFTVQPFGNSLVTLTLTAQQLKQVLEQQFAGCQLPGQPAQTVHRVLLPSRGFQFTWDLTRPPCEKILQVALTVGGTTDLIVQYGVVLHPDHTYRVTVNSFLATGGDGFTVFTEGTERLGGAQDLDALIAYFATFKHPNPPYNPQAALGKPRILRADPGTACPR